MPNVHGFAEPDQISSLGGQYRRVRQCPDLREQPIITSDIALSTGAYTRDGGGGNACLTAEADDEREGCGQIDESHGRFDAALEPQGASVGCDGVVHA